MKANKILDVLDQFKDSHYQKVLINGNWGIGKTKYVIDFIQNYSEACYVSLFGKKDVNSIIQEIYFHILDKAPSGKVKKLMNVLREKMNTLDVSYFGVSLSIPLIANIHKNLNKELGSIKNFVIVLDDLERKHPELDIKEVFGIIDSLSKIEKIKIVLIAATDQLEDVDRETFINYQEKAIDRIYKIEEYADEAPIQILGNSIWRVLEEQINALDFNNLRTFEKTSLFIEEVLTVIEDKYFTDKFTKDDLYRMCFATVFFNIEHNGELRLLDGEANNVEYMKAYYQESENGTIDYLCNFIIQNSLDNVLSKGVFHFIKKWYETGAYNKESLIGAINTINNYKEKTHNFYSSDQEILGVINRTVERIKQLNGSESINEIIFEVSTAISWCEILSIDFDLSNEEILESIKKNIKKKVDVDQNEFNIWEFHTDSPKALSLVESIYKSIKIECFNRLIKKIIECYEQKFYEPLHLKELTQLIEQNPEITIIKEDLLTVLSTYKYLFPFPSGKITEKQWGWCHRIKKLVITIQRSWQIENYYVDFKNYVNDTAVHQSIEDKMLQHRLKELFKQ
ncbi:hypothetical protein JI735_19645 [Paenibacillus sonchi]|uniref:KAP NTPase domain-containing protein n=1 Tax=Paenibacillus sonchi TaxID=373687 RepID=A0A974SB53_9BACL|nr:P-loop NTPase fold protein [Paenibacillus sonchi]QQZ58944.1 hypothetical protein JI735_19645 [Paenibacillus sonchi]